MTDHDDVPADLATDERLRLAWEAMEGAQTAALSLDVFDTLLWRTVPEPVHAFLLLGERLRRAGLVHRDLQPATFARMRVRAEERARERAAAVRDSHEVTLHEICGELAAVLGLSVGTLVDAEVELEREICSPDAGVVALARHVVGKLDKALVLVSDTYFSSDHLRRLLDRPELDGVTPTRIFTSCEVGIGKGNGLHRFVARELGLQPQRIVHVGDNPDADHKAARRARLQAVIYPKYSEELEEILGREGLTPPVLTRETPIDLDGGDFGLTAMRSRALNRTERLTVPPAQRSYWETGATVFGPLLTGFGEWVHRRARELGVDHVYCMMREGDFLSDVITEAAVTAEEPVTTQTLWASRQVCALASVFHATRDELASFLARRRPPTVAGLAEQLGFDLALLPPLLNVADVRLDEPKRVGFALDTIAGSDEVRGIIVANATRLRERFVRYLDQHLPAAGRVVVVDLGWGGTIQAGLARVLAASGRDLQVVGLYLITNHQAVDRRLDGVWMEGYLVDGGDATQALEPISRSPEIIEQVCMPDVGSLIGFDEQLQPQLAPNDVPRTQLAQKAALQKGVLAFQREWNRNVLFGARGLRLDSPAAREQLLRMAWRFVARPTHREAVDFGTWVHDENYGSQAVESVIEDAALQALRYRSLDDLRRLSMAELYWPIGAATIVNQPLAALAAAHAQGALDPEEAAPLSPSGPIELFVDEGGGFSGDSRAVVHPRLGPNGLCLATVRYDSEHIRGVRIDPAGHPGLLRIDWIRLRFHVAGAPEVHVWELRDLRDQASVTVVGAAALASDLLHVTTIDPQLHLRLPPALLADVGARGLAVELEMAYAAVGLDEGAQLTLPPPSRPWRRPPRALLAGVARRGRRMLRAGLGG